MSVSFRVERRTPEKRWAAWRGMPLGGNPQQLCKQFRIVPRPASSRGRDDTKVGSRVATAGPPITHYIRNALRRSAMMPTNPNPSSVNDAGSGVWTSANA